MLRALSQMHLHSEAILHLEISARNVLYQILGEEDEEEGIILKFTDFGLHTTSSTSALTTHPRLKSTDHAPAGPDCDIWSVFSAWYDVKLICLIGTGR